MKSLSRSFYRRLTVPGFTPGDPTIPFRYQSRSILQASYHRYFLSTGVFCAGQCGHHRDQADSSDLQMWTRETLFSLDETACLGGMPWTGPGVFAREAGGNESPLSVDPSFQLTQRLGYSLAAFG